MADACPIVSSLSGLSAVPLSSAPVSEPSATAVLTRRLAAGDEEAFREFHARYFDPLYHFLLTVTRGDAHAAREALQETLLRVARRTREFDEEAAFWDWLKVVARNVARDGGRKRRRYLSLLDRFGLTQRPASPAPVATVALRDLLEEALAEIDADDRALLEGKYVRGATVVELAAERSATEKSVESRLGRVRRELAERLRRKMRAP